MSDSALSSKPAASFQPAAALRPAPGNVFRDIAVHLDGMPEDELRLAHAEALATRCDARLTGLYTNLLPDPALYAGEFGITAIGQLTEAMIEDGNSVERRLRERLARLGPTHELRRIDAFPGMLAQAVATEARWNDLFVATCPREDGLTRWNALIESVMFDGGRGLYLLPPGTMPRQAIHTILIGWVDSRQSARAIAEAMPLLGEATQVHIVTVSEEAHGRMGGAEALADVTAHLARHGVGATASVLRNDISPAESLLAEAGRISADLIVAGAYGHSRFREWILGGVTQDLLAASPVPLLLAH